jgi:hypothetical protein
VHGRCWVGGLIIAAVALTACGDDDASDVTLSSLDVTGGGTVPAATAGPGGQGSGPATTIDPAAAGSGFVSIQVRLPAAGIDETLTLDRATVSADALDPVSLDASCTPLDGGTEMAAAVVDLRRLAGGSRLISAALNVAGGMSAGEHDATLEVSGADQSTTTFTGTAVLVEGGWSGTFEATDANGNTATGSFTCAAGPVETTTTLSAGSGEEVPDSAPPTTSA